MPEYTYIRRSIKILLLVIQCASVGFAVGTLAHYLGFGLSGGGSELWNLKALEFASVEGGMPGGVLGLLVAVPTYYLILHGRASAKEWAILIGVTFATATIAVIVAGALTLGITPMATVTTAVILRSN